MWLNVCALASAACFNADGTFFEFFSNIIMLRMLFFNFFFLREEAQKNNNSRMELSFTLYCCEQTD